MNRSFSDIHLALEEAVDAYRSCPDEAHGEAVLRETVRLIQTDAQVLYGVIKQDGEKRPAGCYGRDQRFYLHIFSSRLRLRDSAVRDSELLAIRKLYDFTVRNVPLGGFSLDQSDQEGTILIPKEDLTARLRKQEEYAMQEITFRHADLPREQAAIDQIQFDVFHLEQGIPADMLGIAPERDPHWFVAVDGDEVIGTTCSWTDEEGKTEFGRYALKPAYRGRHIGTKFIHYAFQQVFDSGVKTIYMECRDVSVHIISAMGGRVTGEPFAFYKGNCTPMILEASAFH